MVKQIFTVYDSKAEFFFPPTMANSKGELIRSFSDLVNDTSKENQVALHPEDYVLFHLGSFDNLNAKYELFPSPVSLGVALEFKKSNEEKGREALDKILPLNKK